MTHGCALGASFHVELEEMKFAGMVTVTAMGPCPPIEKGKGRVVTMTVTHENSHVFELELSGFDAQGRAITETLCPTDVHKLYSVERGWVMTKNLRVGEVLRTQQGAATITSIKRKAGDQRVYNFEVEVTHAYYVGYTRTLSHNTDCPVTQSSGANSAAATGPELLLDTNVVISHGKQYVASGQNVVKASISDFELNNLVSGGRIKMPHAASKIPSVPNSINVDQRINVRALLTPKRTGNYVDSIIGATALERGSTLITSDKSLCNAVNTLGGKAIRK